MTNKSTAGDPPIWRYNYESLPVFDTGASYSSVNIIDSLDIEKLWEKMYNNAKKMWIACGYCNSANALGSPVCCQCGGALGDNHK